MTQVFISYSRRDLSFVERLAKDLKAAGLEVWYDLAGLEVGMRWGREIQDALRSSRFFLVVISPHSTESEWVEREFLYAGMCNLKIIPVLYQTCEMPLWSLNLHYIDMTSGKYASKLPELLNALRDDRQTKKNVPVPDTGEALPAEKAIGREYLPKTVAGQDYQKPPARVGKIRPIWIIALMGLIMVIAFAVWGLPPIKAALAHVSTPTVTATAISGPTSTLSATKFATHTPTTALTPTAGISSIRPKDGMTMMYIPAGMFIMGSDSGDPDAQPVRTVSLDAYWIDQTEVTNGMYAQCVQSKACQPPTSNGSSNIVFYFGNAQYGGYPVINITWYNAKAYCAWAGARLPTEAEWEKAARGTDGRSYPWGNAAPTCSLANFICNTYNGTNDTRDVNKNPSGTSPYGVLNMAGNVAEWASDWYGATYYSSALASNPQGPANGSSRVVRGGSWEDPGSALKTFVRFRLDPNKSDSYTGFRCARTTAP